MLSWSLITKSVLVEPPALASLESLEILNPNLPFTKSPGNSCAHGSLRSISQNIITIHSFLFWTSFFDLLCLPSSFLPYTLLGASLACCSSICHLISITKFTQFLNSFQFLDLAEVFPPIHSGSPSGQNPGHTDPPSLFYSTNSFFSFYLSLDITFYRKPW